MITKKKTKLTNKFKIVSEDNRIFVINEFTEYIETLPNEWIEGLKTLITDEGYHVNINKNDTFYIVELGIKCKIET